jgi:hypothetical protein
MPRMRSLLILWLLLAPMLVVAREVLVDPAPVAVPAGVDAATVAREIKRSLIGRTWTVEAERPGEIEATLRLRKHVARALIRYDATQVHWTYVSSENLDYKEKRGERLIHENYLSWVANVMGDLSRNLQLATLD